jgi:phage tail sheath protein FI
MAFKHGVYIQEEKTPILGVRTVDSALPFVVGTAPPGAPVNQAELVFNYTDAAEKFKLNDDPSYTLNQAAKVFFQLYGVSPAVFVNVFDPAVHKNDAGEPDVNKVTASDVVGGVDATTGQRKGLELIEEVFPRFGKIVGIILAPGFSHDSTVYNVMISKAENLSGFFKAMAYIDTPPDTQTSADAVAFKSAIGSPHAYVLDPPVKYGEETHYLSLHAAALTAKVDAGNDGVPSESPSNKELRISEPARHYTLQEANYLNEQGIATINRMFSGFKLWGNRTAAFPGNTDIKDSFLPNRRMANWIENNLVVNTWQKVDDPMNKRLVESIVDTWNIALGGLVGRNFMIDAEVCFLEEDNPLTDLANGIIRFRIKYLTPPPAEDIEFVLVVDVNYFKNLFK